MLPQPPGQPEATPPKPALTRLIPLCLIDLPSDPINPIDWHHVAKMAAGYEKGDPIPAITVFPVEGGRFEILFGQHRFHARKRGGFMDIAATVLPSRPEPLQALAMQFKENNDHRELTGQERATAFFRAKKLGGLKNKQVAALFEVSEATVSRDLSMGKNLHPTLKDLVARLELVPKAAWAISRLPSDIQVAFYEEHKGEKAEAIAEAVSDKLDVLAGQKPKKPKPVPFSVPGLKGMFTVFDLAKVRAALAQVGEAVTKIEKHSLPFPSLPTLLRGT